MKNTLHATVSLTLKPQQNEGKLWDIWVLTCKNEYIHLSHANLFQKIGKDLETLFQNIKQKNLFDHKTQISGKALQLPSVNLSSLLF